MRTREGFSKIVYLCILLLLVFLLVYSAIRILEATVFLKQDIADNNSPSKTIVRDGVSYFPKQDITVIMVLGIDKFGKVQPSGSYNNDGATDMVSLIVFDEESRETNVLCLNRDTMLSMPVLGIGGHEAGEVFQQLALSHTYGSGLDDSCRNTKKAVSKFLYDLEIDYYVSMNMDAIRLLNDAVGGVKVTVTDDFSGIDSTITKGEITLTGEQAIHFVRTRRGVSDQTNLSRMERHIQYMESFIDAFRSKSAQDIQFVSDTYDLIGDYIVTDCSVKALSSILDDFSDFEFSQVICPEGTNVLTGEYFEFHADKEKLDEMILELFYSPK